MGRPRLWSAALGTLAVAALAVATPSSAAGPCEDAGCPKAGEGYECSLSTCNITEDNGSLNNCYYYCSGGTVCRYTPPGENRDQSRTECSGGGGQGPFQRFAGEGGEVSGDNDDCGVWGADYLGWCI